jgi:hypothetical protein
VHDRVQCRHVLQPLRDQPIHRGRALDVRLPARLRRVLRFPNRSPGFLKISARR